MITTHHTQVNVNVQRKIEARLQIASSHQYAVHCLLGQDGSLRHFVLEECETFMVLERGSRTDQYKTDNSNQWQLNYLMVGVKWIKDGTLTPVAASQLMLMLLMGPKCSNAFLMFSSRTSNEIDPM